MTIPKRSPFLTVLERNFSMFGSRTTVRVLMSAVGFALSKRLCASSGTSRSYATVRLRASSRAPVGEILSLTISVTEKSFAFNLKVFSMAQPSEYLSPFFSYTLPISSAHGGKARRKRRFSEHCANNKMCFAFPNRSIIPPDLQ